MNGKVSVSVVVLVGARYAVDLAFTLSLRERFIGSSLEFVIGADVDSGAIFQISASDEGRCEFW